MAIDLTGLPSLNAGTRNKVSSNATSNRGDAGANSPAASTAPQPETVKLSSQAQMLSKLEERVGQLPEIDESRVASIKQSIEEGSFSIDPERIATKLTALEGRLFD